MILPLLTALFLAAHSHTLPELKRSLGHAEKELTLTQQKILELQEAIAIKEIERIEWEVAQMYEKKAASLLRTEEDRHAFFYEERTTLAQIIHNHPTCSAQAQAVLDKILVIITQFSS